MTDIVLTLNGEITESEYQVVVLFRERFRILWENWESLKSLGIQLGGSFSNKNENKKITGDSCNIDIFRLKGYFVDFRFFYAEKEPTKYFNVASMLSKKCNDPRFYELLKVNKKNWNEAGLLEGWHGFTADEMLNYFFHGEVFHSFPDKREGMKRVLEIMESELATHAITYTIYNRMLVIRNLNWVLSPMSFDNQNIRLPKEYA